MPKIETPAICSVKIDNQEIKNNISLLTLKQPINNHHSLELLVKQIGQLVSDQDFDDPSIYTGFLGKLIAVKITPEGGIVDQSRELEFIGIITDVRLENSIDGLNSVIIIAKSPTISMDGATQVAYFEEQSASDIIGSILSNYPINRGKLESTSSAIQYSVQYQETDYSYIMRLAESSGMFSYYDGKEFVMQKSNGSSSVELNWRESLGLFSMGLGTAASKFGSKSWDYSTKAALTGESDSSSLRSSPSNLAKVSIDASKNLYEKSGYVAASKSTDQSSLDSTISNRIESQVGQMVICSGESIIPEVKVGQCVKINGMGKIDGMYWIKEVIHHLNDSGKYYNEFISSPLEVSYPEKKYTRPSITNLKSAIVTNLEDPDALGRIKVKIPSLDIETLWVRYLSTHAGSDHGWFSLPEVDDEVLVGFENGNMDMPIALGSVYNGTDTPPVDIDNKNETKMFLTKSGNEIRFTDTDGSEELKICTKGGDNQIVMSMSGPSLTIKSVGDISIESDGDIEIKGTNIKIDAQSKIDIKAGADANIEATANVKVKALANLNTEAGTINTIEGPLVKIN